MVGDVFVFRKTFTALNLPKTSLFCNILKLILTSHIFCILYVFGAWRHVFVSFGWKYGSECLWNTAENVCVLIKRGSPGWNRYTPTDRKPRFDVPRLPPLSGTGFPRCCTLQTSTVRASRPLPTKKTWSDCQLTVPSWWRKTKFWQRAFPGLWFSACKFYLHHQSWNTVFF